MFGRPNLYTSYAQESQILPTGTKKMAAAVGILVMFLMPFNLPVINQIPFIRFLGDGDWLRPVSAFFCAGIGFCPGRN